MPTDPIAFEHKGKCYCSTCWIWRLRQDIQADASHSLPNIPAGACAKCGSAFAAMHGTARPEFPVPAQASSSPMTCNLCGCGGEDPEAGCAAPIRPLAGLALKESKRRMI